MEDLEVRLRARLLSLETRISQIKSHIEEYRTEGNDLNAMINGIKLKELIMVKESFYSLLNS